MAAETFGNRLRRLRKEQNLTMREVAQRIGVPVTTYREWEYGRSIVGEPYPKLAEVFKVSLGELIVGEMIGKKDVVADIQVIEQRLVALKRKVESLF